METAYLEEGLAYAVKNFQSDKTHLQLDKTLIKENFDLHNKEVLDFGCGMGGMSLWFARELGAHVEGVDIDENHIEVALQLNEKFKVPNVTFRLRNIITDPLDKQFDFIFLNDVIEHIKLEWIQDVLDILIMKNLKKGGTIFFSYPPWEGPHASHVQRVVHIPWVQFLPQKLVLKLISDHNQKLVGKNDLLSEYLELNHMTHKKLMFYLRKYNLAQVLRESHAKTKVFPFLKNINPGAFPLKYFVTKELIAFKKL